LIDLSLIQIGGGFLIGIVFTLWVEWWIFNHVIDDVGDVVERLLGRRGKRKLKDDVKDVQ
jgi:hypothetical protein